MRRDRTVGWRPAASVEADDYARRAPRDRRRYVTTASGELARAEQELHKLEANPRAAAERLARQKAEDTAIERLPAYQEWCWLPAPTRWPWQAPDAESEARLGALAVAKRRVEEARQRWREEHAHETFAPDWEAYESVCEMLRREIGWWNVRLRAIAARDPKHAPLPLELPARRARCSARTRGRRPQRRAGASSRSSGVDPGDPDADPDPDPELGRPITLGGGGR